MQDNHTTIVANTHASYNVFSKDDTYIYKTKLTQLINVSNILVLLRSNCSTV